MNSYATNSELMARIVRIERLLEGDAGLPNSVELSRSLLAFLVSKQLLSEWIDFLGKTDIDEILAPFRVADTDQTVLNPEVCDFNVI